MKTTTRFGLAFFGLSLLGACGSPIQLGDSSSTPGLPSIPSNSVMYLDSSYVDGNYGTGTSACSPLTWTDLSGNRTNGSLTNFTCSGSSGWSGTGSTSSPFVLNFDSSGRVETSLAVSPSIMPSTTWEIWAKPARVNYGVRQQLLSSDNGGFDRSVLIEGGTSNFGVFTGTGVWTPVAVDLNQWQHIAVVFTPTDILLYKNGVQYDFGSAPSYDGSNSNLMVGANPAFGEMYLGSVALFAVYDRALSASEISDHCKAFMFLVLLA